MDTPVRIHEETELQIARGKTVVSSNWQTAKGAYPRVRLKILVDSS